LENSGTAGEGDSGSGVIERMQVLARRVAELHVALATRTGDAAFDPEPIARDDLASWAAAVEREIDETLAQLARFGSDPAAPLSALLAEVAQAGPALHQRVSRAANSRPVGLKTRLHGDLHLGQVLLCRDDFVVVDFEGEPQRPLQERRVKHSALRDVAGMLRSFDYARHAALNQVAKTVPEVERLTPLSLAWGQRVRDAFLATYRGVAIAGGLYADAGAFDAALELLTVFEIEKAFYELRYEMG